MVQPAPGCAETFSQHCGQGVMQACPPCTPPVTRDAQPLAGPACLCRWLSGELGSQGVQQVSQDPREKFMTESILSLPAGTLGLAVAQGCALSCPEVSQSSLESRGKGKKTQSTSLLWPECLMRAQDHTGREQFQSHSICFPPIKSETSRGGRRVRVEWGQFLFGKMRKLWR